MQQLMDINKKYKLGLAGLNLETVSAWQEAPYE